jgi:hypothetical protein
VGKIEKDVFCILKGEMAYAEKEDLQYYGDRAPGGTDWFADPILYPGKDRGKKIA